MSLTCGVVLAYLLVSPLQVYGNMWLSLFSHLCLFWTFILSFNLYLQTSFMRWERINITFVLLISWYVCIIINAWTLVPWRKSDCRPKLAGMRARGQSGFWKLSPERLAAHHRKWVGPAPSATVPCNWAFPFWASQGSSLTTFISLSYQFNMNIKY